ATFTGTITDTSLSGCLEAVNNVVISTGSLCGSGGGGGGNGMVWPASPGIADYGGGNSWGVSFTVSGNGSVLAATNSPTFIGTSQFAAINASGSLTLGADIYLPNS